jgi:hypothetical protein
MTGSIQISDSLSQESRFERFSGISRSFQNSDDVPEFGTHPGIQEVQQPYIADTKRVIGS